MICYQEDTFKKQLRTRKEECSKPEDDKACKATLQDEAASQPTRPQGCSSVAMTADVEETLSYDTDQLHWY